MIDYHVSPIDAYRVRCFFQELIEKLGLEAVSVKLQVFEFLSLDQATHAISFEHDAVASTNISSGRALGCRKTIADDLEDHVVRRKREDEHHQSGIATGQFEVVLVCLHVSLQAAVELCLAMLVEADGNVQLCDRLAR